MVMNTAQAHFNPILMQEDADRQNCVLRRRELFNHPRLASQDTVENAIAEVGLNNVSLKTRFFQGDTLYAFSRVLEKCASDREMPGSSCSKHWVSIKTTNSWQRLSVRACQEKSHWLRSLISH